MTKSSETTQAREAAAARKRIMEVLAAATETELSECWQGLAEKPAHTPVRGPETGLLMVKGRMGGGGAPFNLGEVTITRASVRLSSGTVGHAHILGTDRPRARLAALLDALWQSGPDGRNAVERLAERISSRLAAEEASRIAETAATKVDFFTMARGNL